MDLDQQPFKAYFNPLTNLSTLCIRHSNVVVKSFELKPSVLDLKPSVLDYLLSFYSLENEDLYNHLNDCHFVCQTFKYENFLEEDVKLRLFPFALKDRARSWFNTLPSNSITLWKQMLTKFFNKYFPVHKTNTIRRKISKFTQGEDEQFFKVWNDSNNYSWSVHNINTRNDTNVNTSLRNYCHMCKNN